MSSANKGKGGSTSLPKVTKAAPSPKSTSTAKSPQKVNTTAEKLPKINNTTKQKSESSAGGGTSDESSPEVKEASQQVSSEAGNPATSTDPPAQTVETAAVTNGVETASSEPAKAAEVSASKEASTPPVDAASSAPAEPPKSEEPPRIIKRDGNVTLIYEQYNEQFPIVNGSTTHENIDEVYCLSFVMPGCLIHLSTLNPTQKREREVAGDLDLFIREEPRGTYHDLEADQTYYVYVEQEADQLARDQEITRRKLAGANVSVQKDAYGNTLDEKGRVLESCSCLYGNPCVDDQCCKDWDNRFAVATKNGWKGF